MSKSRYKFRARDKRFKMFIYQLPNGYRLDLSGKFFVIDSAGKNFRESDEFELIQSVGLLDKNGVEIYFDCEIFKFKRMLSPSEHIELIGVMTWSDEDLRAEIDIYPENNEGGYVCLSYIGNGQMYDFEVIGNKYEHKHLLDNK